MQKQLSLLFLILVFSVHSFGQSINELESALLSQFSTDNNSIIQVGEDEEDQDTSESTRIKKLESAVAEAEQILRDLKSDLKDRDYYNEDGSLKRFGHTFFNSIQTTFVPTGSPNTDSSYILDRGDTLLIQYVGQSNSRVSSKINEDGSINLPDIGNVSLSGLSLGEASNLVSSLVTESLIGVEASLSISSLRDMNIFITGAIEQPGMYTVAGGSSILAVIDAAGGISSTGSFRTIKHKRNNQLLEIIDLYPAIAFGDLLFKNPLRNGDSIVVMPKGNEIKITGGAAHQGIFEIKDQESLRDALEFAGIFQTSRSMNITIERVQLNPRTFTKFLVNEKNASSQGLFNGDSIQIPFFNPDLEALEYVSISGAVRIPGKYSIADNTTLSDLINSAGGYTSDAYSFGAALFRSSSYEIERIFNLKDADNIFDRFIASSNSGRGNQSLETLQFVMNQIEQRRSKGRVITEFDLFEIESNPGKDIKLESGDEIVIPKFQNLVYIFGAVNNSTAVSYDAKKKAKDYLQLAAGRKDDLAFNGYIVVQPNGISEVYKSSRFVNIFKNTPEIYPGSVIFVPTDLTNLDSVEYLNSVTPILSNLTLALASLNTISN